MFSSRHDKIAADHEPTARTVPHDRVSIKLAGIVMAIVGAGGTLTGCGEAKVSADQPTTPTPVAAQTAEVPSPATRQPQEAPSFIPNSSEAQTSTETPPLSVLNEKTFYQVTKNMDLDQALAFEKQIVDLVAIPNAEWKKLPQGEQAYRAGLYVEALSSYSTDLDDTFDEGIARENDPSFTGVTSFMPLSDFQAMGTKNEKELKNFHSLELARRGWESSVGFSFDEQGKYDERIQRNIIGTVYGVNPASQEAKSTGTYSSGDLSKVNIETLNSKGSGFGYDDQDTFLYYPGKDSWVSAPNYIPVSIRADCIETGHSGRVSHVVLFSKLG